MSYSQAVQDIELSVQAAWRLEGVDSVDLDDRREGKRYVLGMFPYPSGNAHMGHILVYSISDAIARLGRFKGLRVLHPIGWDSFGLPAENAAIKNNVHPAAWTKLNIDRMRGSQIGRAGFSFDLSKEVDTSSVEFYRWTQWLFLKLYEHGQVYRAKSWVNWDPVDQTVLANEQVIDGKGWRSGAPIERREMEQWCFRITSFAEQLWDGLGDLSGWSERAVAAQRNWIGRSTGCEIEFPVVGSNGASIRVFTTRPDTIFGVTSLTLAPEHDLAKVLPASAERSRVDAYIRESLLKSEVDRQADGKSGISIGRDAVNPLTGEVVPIYVSDYVLASYGTGAIMNVPAHDERDFEFAQLAGLPVRFVIEPVDGTTAEATAFTGEGRMVRSGDFSGMASDAARAAIAEHIERKGFGSRTVRYRLRDWTVSRQRFWGAPIPMLRRPDGSWEPVLVSQLPVVLPTEVNFKDANGKSPLALDPSFYNTISPTDGVPCVREVDTMDTFMCSAWYAWRFLDPLNDAAPFRTERSDRWMPIDYYVGGLEHANQHLIYFRYISHFLHSIGLTPTREPVSHFLDNGMIQKGGMKMSKSLGNVVRPDEVIELYGADALRMYVLSDTPYTRDREWEDAGLGAKQRFLGSIWSLYALAGEQMSLSVEREAPRSDEPWCKSLLAALYTTARDTEVQIEERQAFHVVVAKIHSFTSLLRTALAEAHTNERKAALSFALQNFLKVLGLISPHLADHLWRERFGAARSLFFESWVPIDQDVIASASQDVSVVISVDGKRRHEIKIDKGASDDELRALIEEKRVEQLANFIADRIIVKVVVVRGSDSEPRLLNIVTK